MTAEQMREMTARLGGQLAWAARLDPPRVPEAGEGLVCGMGGSGIGGDFAGALAELEGRRVSVHKSYGLPGWAPSARPLVVAVSYSGNTEETLSAVAAAREAGLAVVAVTSGGTLGEIAGSEGFPVVVVPGGLQPRAALGYLLGGLLRVLAAAGVIGDPGAALAEAAELATALSGPSGAAEGLARDLAERLDGRIVAVYGSVGLTAPVAQRWKTQINENGKWPAWWAVFPELDHNEIVGWSGRPDLDRRVGIVTLRDDAEPPPIAARFRLTEEVTSESVAWVGEVRAQGSSPLARMISLTAVGDLVSLELARLAGVDPVPVDVIESLKRRLSEES